MEEYDILETLEDWDKPKGHELLSFMGEREFVVAMFGIRSDIFMRHDDPEDYSDFERQLLIDAAQRFITEQDNSFIILVMKTLVFNCQCSIGGVYIIMSEINDHLVDHTFDMDC